MGGAVAWFSVITFLLLTMVWASVATCMLVFSKKPESKPLEIVESDSTQQEIERLKAELKQKPVSMTLSNSVRKADKLKPALKVDNLQIYTLDAEKTCLEQCAFAGSEDEPAIITALAHAIDNLQDNEWVYFTSGSPALSWTSKAQLAAALRIGDFATLTSNRINDGSLDMVDSVLVTKCMRGEGLAARRNTLQTHFAVICETFLTHDGPDVLRHLSLTPEALKVCRGVFLGPTTEPLPAASESMSAPSTGVVAVATESL